MRSSCISGSSKRIPLAGILILVVLPSLALAQVSLLEDLAPRYEWSGRVATDFLNQFEADTDGNDEVEYWRLGLSADAGGPINESILVGFHTRYQRTDFDFKLGNGPSSPPVYGTSKLPKDPWGGIDTVDLLPSTTILIGDRFSVVAAVPIRWSGEVGTDRNAFKAGISAIATWQVTERLRAGLGLGVTSQVEDDAEFFPLVALDWEISEAFHLTTEGSWYQGGHTTLYWGPGEFIALSLSAGYERNRFRLDDNGTLRDTDGVGEVSSVPVEVGLRLGRLRGIRLDFRAGFGFAGKLRVETDDGKKLYDEDYDPAPRLGLSVTIPIGPFGS